MSRLSRTRASRVLVTVVVAGIVTASVVEYRRTRHPAAVAARPTSATPAVLPDPKVPGPLLTRTTPSGLPPMLSAATAPPPAPVTPDPVPTGVAGAAVLGDARAKVAGGDLLAARKLLNDALVAGTVSDAGDVAAAKKQLADVNSVLLFSGRPFPADPLGGVYKVAAGDRLSTIARAHGVPYELLMQLNHMTDARKLRYGQTLKVINGPFYAVVTKSKFTLDLYLGAPGGTGSTYVESFPVGLGENNSTPTGLWEIKNKAPSPAYYSPRGEGVIPPGDPKNPLGPFWLGLEGTDGNAVGAESYGIHGTIDPASIGKMASMGCIRLRNDDIGQVYKLLVEKKSKVRVLD